MKPAQTKDIATLYHQARSQGQSFVAFRLPNAKKVNYLTGTASRSLKDGEKAFAFAPFDPEQKPYFIKADTKAAVEKLLLDKKQKSTSKKQFTDLVKNIIAAIRSGDYKKIVAARVLAVAKPASFDPAVLFEKLCTRYESAFVSLTYIPNVGLWVGASPEVLVAETSSKLTTYSLAGTKTIDDGTDWTAKEIEEQQIVTDFIYKKVEKTVDEKIKVKGPTTHAAGTLKHLLSVFTIQHKGKSLWKPIAKALHPTPAVGGMPQQKAVKFISQQESFDRAYYAGYLGPVNWNGRTDLFVNLRCMEITESQLLFYAGCGVTTDSNPEKEWQESERKIAVLKSLI